MNFPDWLDAIFIFPFRLLPFAYLSMWLGTALLAFYTIILGEATSGVLFVVGKKRYLELQKKMVDAHNQSVKALHAGDKESFLAINTMAHEAFGKYFFSQACLGMASLWPAPFALAWLASRFQGVQVLPWPSDTLVLGFPFVFILCYIVLRIFFGRWKKSLPFFRHISELQEEMKALSRTMKSMFRLENAENGKQKS